MKIFKLKITYIAMSCFMLIAISCQDDFLEVPVTGQVSESQLGSENGLDGLLIGTYAALNGHGDLGWFSGYANWLWGSIRGGDANKGSNAGDFTSIIPIMRFEVNPTNGELNSKWRGSYEGISRANIFLQNLKASEEVSEERKTEMAAEARFLRGHFYFELKKNFDDTPYVDETMTIESGATEVPNNQDLWPMIEADFQYAFDNLPETQEQVGRANKWAAAAYLAKAYMYQDKFTEAKGLYDQIIADGQTSNGLKYALVPAFYDLFRGDTENNAETVFGFQAAAGTGSVNNTNHEIGMNYPYNTGPSGPGNCCGFFAPSFELVNSYRTNAEGLPLLSGAYNQPANAVKSDMGLQSDDPFTPDQGPLDPRLDHTVGRRGIMFLDWMPHPGFDWIRDQAYAGPYTPKKYSYEKAEEGTYQDGSSWTPGYQSINFMIIRYADVLLMAAEAEVEVGSMEKAREYVNMVRERAANSTLLVDGTPAANYVVGLYNTPWADKETARKAVRFERKLELALEGQRFYDLLRWGVVADAMNAYLDYEATKLPNQLGGAEFEADEDEYLPIPQIQIDLQGSDVLTQNPGY